LNFIQASLTDDGSYYAVVSGISPCSAVTSNQVTLNVDQSIAVTTQPISQTVCENATNVSFSAMANAGGDPLTYQWRKNGVNILGETASTFTIPTATFATAGNYDVLITGPSGYTCPSVQSAIALLTINPNPIGSAVAQTICSGSATNVALNSTVIGTTFTWTAAVQTTPTNGTITGFSANSGTPIIQTLTNTGTTAAVIRYTVTPTANSCPGTPFTVDVTINPKPIGSALAQAICSGSTTSIALNATVSGTTYSWTAAIQTTPTGGTISGFSNSSGNAIAQTLTNTGTTAAVIRYTVTPTANSCPGNPFTIDVTINPTPIGSAASQAICTGLTTNVTLNSTVIGTTYSWTAAIQTNPTGGIISGFSNSSGTAIAQTLTNTGVTAAVIRYTVTPTANSCPGIAFTVDVTINPTPAVSNMTAVTCSTSGFTATPINSTDGIVPAGTTYTWGVPTVTGGVAGGVAGSGAATTITGTLTNPTNTAQTATYTVTPVSGGCIGNTFTVTVTVNPKPAVSNMTYTACSAVGFTTTPINSTNGIVPAGTTYTWLAPTVTGGVTGGLASLGAASSITGTLTNPTNSAQTATYTITPVSGSCIGNTFTVTVTVNPKPAISNITSVTCSAAGFTSTPVNSTNGIVPAGTTYTWGIPAVTGGLTGGVAGSGAASSITGTLANPTNSPQTATYTVTPISGSCTGNTFTVTVTVNPKPAISNTTSVACSAAGFTLTPANSTNGIVPAGTTYTWGIPTVTGGLTGGVASSGAASTITGTLTNPTNSAQTATYTVTPLSGGCTGNTFTVTITVNPKPTVSNMTSVTCSAAGFTSIPVTSTNGIVPAGTTYTWGVPTVTGGLTGGVASSGAATSITGTVTNPTNSAQTATYTVTPVSGSCTGNTFTVTVTVNPKPAISNMTATTCSAVGFTATPINSTNGIVPGGTTYTWTIPTVTGGLTGGQASSGTPANITGILTNPTNSAQTATYTVTPVSGGCTGNTFTVIVTINAATVGGTTTIRSTANSANPDNGSSRITDCFLSSGVITLTGHTGAVIRWESSINAGNTWTNLGNPGSLTYSYTNATTVTTFRAVLQNANCSTLNSATSILFIIPNIKPTPISASPSTICEGESAELISESSFSSSQNLAEGGLFDIANPPGWTVDNGNFPANGDNGTNNGFSETNGNPGDEYDSGDGKFAIVRGNRDSFLRTPTFDLLGLASAYLTFDHAYKLNDP
jgi:hypothetical protein